MCIRDSTTIAEMGPLLLARLLNLNEVQGGVLNSVFKIADDNGWLLLDLKDLRAMMQHAAENSATYQAQYGNISAASVGAVQRSLLELETQGADQLFGEPALNLDDLMQTDADVYKRQILVSHDRALLRATCDEFILVADGSAEPFESDLEGYSAWLNEQRLKEKQATQLIVENKPNKNDRAANKIERQARIAARRPLLKMCIRDRYQYLQSLSAG